jgi:hypothetical protein
LNLSFCEVTGIPVRREIACFKSRTVLSNGIVKVSEFCFETSTANEMIDDDARTFNRGGFDPKYCDSKTAAI